MFTTFLVLAGIALAVQTLVVFVAFFGPELAYDIKEPPDAALDSDRFCSLVATLSDAQPHAGNRVEVLTNGDAFYEAELNAIGAATGTINLEAYIFHRGEIARRFVGALTERARAGVKVKLILDYIGSFSTFRSYFRELTEAGGRVGWYHSARPDLIPQLNNRTHRELLVIDGAIGFIGGAGIADHWYKSSPGHAQWRDTVCRVTGPAVVSLQSVFAENWLRVTGEILTGDEYFRPVETGAGSVAMVVASTPAAGSTRARILFQLLLATAQKRIYITTPYFLPDRSARRAIRHAVRDRNVDVRILTPGKRSDHAMTRSSSRRLYGSVLKAGARVYEYEPAMLHAKVMIIDDVWSVLGSTNFDHRSFELNDEVNLAVLEPALASRLTDDFRRDLAQSREITYEQWRGRALFRVSEWLGTLIEKQQ